MAMLDFKTGKLIYVNGGHNPPIVYKKSEDKFEYLQVEENCVLETMNDLDLVQQETTLNHGDIIYLYTEQWTSKIINTAKKYFPKF